MSTTDSISTDGAPITVTLWDAEHPTVTNTHTQVKKVPVFFWLPYFCFRWAYIRIFG